jgi:hypothetical protein
LKREEVIGGALIFLFGAVTAYLSLQMPVGTFRAAGSGLFPLGLGILLMGLSLILCIRSWGLSKSIEEKMPKNEGPRSAKQVILFLGAVVLATFLFGRLGYPLMSFLLLLVLLRTLGVKRWSHGLSLSILTATAVYFLFVVWLQIPLPKGWIGL